jgi:hypothetical protein
MTRSTRAARDALDPSPTQVGVWVVIDGRDVEAGTLYSRRRRGAESATFAYAPQYLNNPAAYALDPALARRLLRPCRG